MKKTIIIVLALIVFSPTANAREESDKGLINDQLDKVTIQLKWFHQFQFAGYYAAIEKGFYSEEGLEVALRQRVARTSHIDDVLLGRAQYGVADAGLLWQRLQGKPVVLLAQIFQHSPLVLITLKDSGILVAEDLAGKHLMFDSVGHADIPLIVLVLDTFGSLDAVEVHPKSFNPQQRNLYFLEKVPFGNVPMNTLAINSYENI
jgi:ABC-type nitrate/sulfonate/bicarbonate transport system substrate-binding protein